MAKKIKYLAFFLIFVLVFNSSVVYANDNLSKDNDIELEQEELENNINEDLSEESPEILEVNSFDENLKLEDNNINKINEFKNLDKNNLNETDINNEDLNLENENDLSLENNDLSLEEMDNGESSIISDESFENLFLDIDISGMNINDIQEYLDKLNQKGVSVDLSYDYSDSTIADCIIETSSTNLSELQENDTLNILVSLGKNLDDLSLDCDIIGLNILDVQDYLDKLERNGVIVNIEYDNSSLYDADSIMDVSTLNLSELQEGDILNIIVSLGPNNLESPLLMMSNPLKCVGPLTPDGNKPSNSNNGDAANEGYMLDWDNIPATYEYNWDNSENCWNYGVWVDGQCYKTPVGEYSTDVRHKMQLYCDGDYVYLHVIFSRDYGANFNGEDYRFYFNGNDASFQVEWPNGGTITNLYGKNPGEYSVEVKHRNEYMSYDKAEGMEGHLFINPGDINNQLEIKIPVEEMIRQNPNINLNSMTNIEFFTPNLMYNRISCAGVSTFPIVSVGIISIIAIGGFLIRRKRGFLNV